jgi:hypothetical protein
MITFNDLKSMDFFLMQHQRISNQPKEHKEQLDYLRKLIAKEMSKKKVNIK